MLCVFLACIQCASRIEECGLNEERDTEPETVYDLHPGDICSIAGIGDSHMSGFGMKRNKGLNIDGMVYEDLGASFFCGGDPGVPTVANFLRRFNPGLVGVSRGSSPVYLCENVWCNPGAKEYSPEQNAFNSGFGGSTSAHLGRQLDYLRDTFKHKRKDLMWKRKLIGVYIGETDLFRNCCEAASGKSGSAEFFEASLEKALVRIEGTFPKTLVVLYLLPEMSGLDSYLALYPRCHGKWSIATNMCPCVLLCKEKYLSAWKQFNEAIWRVSDKFQGKGSYFGVTVVPCLWDTVNRGAVRNDRSTFTSKDDCFSMSLEAHRAVATSTWNSLFVSPEKRRRNIDTGGVLYCPTGEDRFSL
ncbi:MAG: uncharacterized protein A8A55_1655 [Amphiamblys sp. WSBS2006]|nr:MAG: uncharacterized protein A8A55_1655 [Amphiamblys sp. WSBS2006]